MSEQNEAQVEPSSLSKLMTSEPEVPDYASKFSPKGSRMQMLELRKTYIGVPNLLIMNQGQPSTDPLPLASVTFDLKTGETVTLDEAMISAIGRYSTPNGIPGMYDCLLDLQIKEHQPPQVTFKNHPSPYGLALTCGSLSGLKGCLEVLVAETDTILTEEIVYASFLGLVQNHGGNCQSVACDGQGMIPESLDELMTSWERCHPGKVPPKLLYVIPYGNNPVDELYASLLRIWNEINDHEVLNLTSSMRRRITCLVNANGYNWSDERMVEIYLLCRKHDLLILDDGAYHFLRWGKKNHSFPSLDVDGRVLRVDTFSKTVGAGHRVGWITGPKVITEKVAIDAGTSYMHPSCLSQTLILSILKTWGHDRFSSEMHQMAEFYRKRSENVLRAANKYLKGLALCRIPAGGMFVWVDILGITDSVPVVQRLKERGLVVVAGKFFRADGGPSNGIRLSISAELETNLEKAVKILAEVLLEYRDKSGS